MGKELITHCVIDESLGIKYVHDQDNLFVCSETKETICRHCLDSIYEDSYYSEWINEMPVYTKTADSYLRMVSIPKRVTDLKRKELVSKKEEKQSEIKDIDNAIEALGE